MNDLFLTQFQAGTKFSLMKLLSWVRQNFSALHKRQQKLLYAEMEKSPLRLNNR